MRKKTLILCAAFLVVTLAFAAVMSACGEEETSTTAVQESTTTTGQESSTTASTGESTETSAGGGFKGQITVGALLDLTGAMALNAGEIKWAYELAVKDINDAGGVKLPDGNYELVLKEIDSKSDENEAAAATEKLIKVEGVKLILGGQTTPINQAAGTVADKYQALFQTAYIWTPFAREKQQAFVADLFFAPGEGGVGEVPFQIWEKLPADTRPMNWAVLTEDNADGQGFGEGVKACAALHGLELVEYQTYTPGTKDYSSVILKFKEAEVDGLVVLVSSADGITFTKQMKEQNFAPKILVGMKGFWPTEYATALGADANYVLHDGFWHPDLGYPLGQEIADAYAAAFDGQSTLIAGLPYALVQVLATAIERAGSTDPAAVRDEIFGGSFPGTAMGDLQYDEMGVCDIEPVAAQWMNGERVLIYPGHETDLQYFKPWNER